MNKRCIKLILFILYLNILYVPINAWAKNEAVKEINDLILKEKTELEKLEKEIRSQVKALSKIGEKKYSILKKQRILDDQLKSKARELKIYNWNLNLTKKKIKNLMKSINNNMDKIDLHRKAMANRLRMIYKEGHMYPIKIAFSSSNFTDLLTRFRFMERLVDFDSKLFYDYDQLNIKLIKEKDDLLESKTKLLAYKKSASNKKNQIKNEKNKKEKFLGRLVREKKSKERLKVELVRSSKRLNSLILKLEKKKILGKGLDIVDKKGRLVFPVKGKILNKFGRKRDKKFDTFIVYNGINIRSPKGSAVRAVFEGNVLYTGTLEGYGNIIIVGHGKEYHSLYGHLDEIITKTEKTVRMGQIIGKSGDTGSILGESLYFEIRYKGNPIEPTAWFIRPVK